MALEPIPCLTVAKETLGAKPEFQDLGMQLLSLNSELATGTVCLSLSTGLLSDGSLSACTGVQGHCWDAKGRTKGN